MKRQDINLYLPEFHPKSVGLSFARSIWLSAFFVILLAVQYWSNGQQLSHLQVEHEQKSQLDHANSMGLIVDQLQQRQQQLEEEIKQKSQEMANKQYISQTYGETLKKEEVSVASLFLGFSEGALDGLSLSKIEMHRGGEELLLSGYSIDQQIIPRYLKRLQAHHYFSASYFGLLQIGRMNDKGMYQFSMKKRASFDG